MDDGDSDTLRAVSDAYTSAIATIDRFREEACAAEEALRVLFDQLDDHLVRAFQAIRYERPSPCELRDFAERSEALLAALRDGRSELRHRLDSMSSRVPLEGVRAVMVDLQLGYLTDSNPPHV